MSKLQIQVYECDRCGRVQEIRSNGQEYDWGFIAARHQNGPLSIGRDKHADMCPGCTSELSDWWKAGKTTTTGANQ